jgi:hypothetical protein
LKFDELRHWFFIGIDLDRFGGQSFSLSRSNFEGFKINTVVDQQQPLALSSLSSHRQPKSPAQSAHQSRAPQNQACPMAAAVTELEVERRVMAAVKASAERGDPPLLQAAEAARCIREAPASAPGGLALSQALVANLCFAHNTAAMWKLLDQAMLSRLVDPLHTLALLTPRCLSERFDLPFSFINWVSALVRFQMLSCRLLCWFV